MAVPASAMNLTAGLRLLCHYWSCPVNSLPLLSLEFLFKVFLCSSHCVSGITGPVPPLSSPYWQPYPGSHPPLLELLTSVKICLKICSKITSNLVDLHWPLWVNRIFRVSLSLLLCFPTLFLPSGLLYYFPRPAVMDLLLFFRFVFLVKMKSLPYLRFMLEVRSQWTLLAKAQGNISKFLCFVVSVKTTIDSLMDVWNLKGCIYCGSLLTHVYLLWLIVCMVRASRLP